MANASFCHQNLTSSFAISYKLEYGNNMKDLCLNANIHIFFTQCLCSSGIYLCYLLYTFMIRSLNINPGKLRIVQTPFGMYLFQFFYAI